MSRAAFFLNAAQFCRVWRRRLLSQLRAFAECGRMPPRTTSWSKLLLILMAQSRLSLGNLSRRTLPPQEDASVFPARQFWYDNATQKVWWDLEGFLQSLRTTCNKLQKRNHWLDCLDARASADLASDPPFSLRPCKESSSSALQLPIRFLRGSLGVPYVGVPKGFLRVPLGFFGGSLGSLGVPWGSSRVP